MLSNLISLVGKRTPSGYKPQLWPEKFDNIIIAMSSGVDSSASAALFSSQYPNARGIFMQNWSKSQSLTDPAKEPCYEKDWKDVCKVAKFLSLPVERVNFEKDYWLDVFEPMLSQYNEGLTPNPDIGCNKFVKFGKLRQLLDEKYGTNNYWLVTGHYSRILSHESSGKMHLLRSFYTKKDQSYYLSQLNSDIFGQLILPIGHLTKPEVRSFAESLELPTAKKPDSQGICFVNNSQHGKFNRFLEHYLPDSNGDIITVDEATGAKTKWGRHKGLWSYTIGQKIGLSMPQADPKYSGTWYVSEKLKSSNELVIVRGKNNRKLYKDTILVDKFESLMSDSKELRDTVESALYSCNLNMQYRSLQDPIKVKSCVLSSDGKSAIIQLVSEQRAMAPGQYCCLYVGDRVLGSGQIASADSSIELMPISREFV